MAIEYERKFAATPAALEKAQQRLGGLWTEYRMQTTYYDTPDGSLSARRWMLRQRLENGKRVCTLKTPAGDSRNEWEVCREEIEDGITALCKLGAPKELPELTAAGVRAICGAEFTRLAATVTLEGAQVEVALDRGILFAGQRKVPLCELEVELKTGSRAAADAFASSLAAGLGLEELSDSKFKRARALMDTAPSVKPE